MQIHPSPKNIFLAENHVRQNPRLLSSQFASSLMKDSLNAQETYLDIIPRDITRYVITPYIDESSLPKIHLAPRRTQDAPLDSKKMFWIKVSAKVSLVAKRAGILFIVVGGLSVSAGGFFLMFGYPLPLIVGFSTILASIILNSTAKYFNNKVTQKIQVLAAESIDSAAVTEFKNDLQLLGNLRVLSDETLDDHDACARQILYYLEVADQFFLKYQDSPLLLSQSGLVTEYNNQKNYLISDILYSTETTNYSCTNPHRINYRLSQTKEVFRIFNRQFRETDVISLVANEIRNKL